MATAAKDMWVANLVESWRGDQSSVPVHEFFEFIDEAAEMGRLSAKDKLRLARLKLKGVAKAFYSTQPELKGDEIEYADFRAIFVQRFKDKHTDQYDYTRLQNASQMKDESPEMYSDRLRKLCQRTVQQTENPAEQAILNREAHKRLLAAFISGLRGVPEKHVRLQMPDTIDSAKYGDSSYQPRDLRARRRKGGKGSQTESICGKRQPWKFTGTKHMEPPE
jgi:hypothetical protein